MKPKLIDPSRFSFYFPFVWGPLLIIGFSAMGSFRELNFWGFDGYSYLISLLAVVTGVGLIRLGVDIRRLANANEELNNEVRLQNERIWRLEDAVAELKGSRPRAD